MVKMVHPCSVVVAWRVSGILVWYQGSLVGLGSILHVCSQTSTMSLLAITFRLCPAPPQQDGIFVQRH